MGDEEHQRSKALEAYADLQAFDYARSKAGNVAELFDVLAGKLRPGRQTSEQGDGLGGTSLSNKSVLRAHYTGSAEDTVLGMANLRRIQTFLDEPQKHLGQVLADIEKEVGSFYGQVSSRPQGLASGNQQMQRGSAQLFKTKQSRRVSFEDTPEMNKYLGPSSRFGDGDGSYWDRWLTTTGHFTEQEKYAKADMPTCSMYSSGVVTPLSGFKRYQLDHLAFTRDPIPRVLTYAARRELGESIKSDGPPKRLHGAYSEARLERHPERTSLAADDRERLDEAVLAKAADAFQTPNGLEPEEKPANVVQGVTRGGEIPGPENNPATASSSDKGRPASEWLKHRREPIETLNSTPESGQTDIGSNHLIEGYTAVYVRQYSASYATLLKRGDCFLEGAMASLGVVHPNYFGPRAKTNVYEYYKQISRRRHQYGDLRAMSCIPLSPLNHTGEISAYKAGVDAIASSLSEGKFDNNRRSSDEKGRNGRNTPHQLPPLATNKAGGVLGESTEDQDDDVSAAGKDEREVTSRTKYLVRCMEHNIAPRAHVIIRKTYTTQVNLAHQGMGDVMGKILADCLVELPLMRKLNLRDNRLTDKGLMPIVKAIKQRHDLHALDLSENKLDRWAARELAQYFSDPRCTLAKLVLTKADVDDFEASNFVKHMKANKTLTHLNLSHNLIGSQESINYVRPEFYTGAEALADWISTGSCPLKYLDVSWNTIRLDSAVYFGNAVAYATDLKELDLSFNCFGAKGGEAIGASLHVNTSLKTLGIASNAINPRACFVICQGLLQNSSIRDIDLSNNPLGKVGIGCVMQLPTEVGDRIKVRLASCNFMVGCEACWFDDDQVRPSYGLGMDEPYDRAVAFHLIRRAARDEGLKLKRVAHTMAGEAEKEIHLVEGVGQAERGFADKTTREEIFRKYDENGTGSLDSDELRKALVDLDLAGEHQASQPKAHDDGDGRIEESEFHEFIEESVLQSKKRKGRTKGFLAEESSPGNPWKVPPEGKLWLEFEYQCLHIQGYHTSAESTGGLLAMLSDIGDGLADVMTHALNFVSLNVEQGMKMYSTVCKHMGGDKIKALAKLVPRMESPTDARFLKNLILRWGLDDRRKLRHELGPAYGPLMGTPMGHFELDLAKPMHRLAARKILEANNLEKLARQTSPHSVFDVSQRGDWDNTRNETVNGKPCRQRGTILEALPKAGALELDYVSTTRPPVRISQCPAQPGRKRAMNMKRFYDTLRKVGLGDDEAWADVIEKEGYVDRAIDNALQESPPRPRTRKMFEHLYFLRTGEGQVAEKKPIPSRPSAMDRQSTWGSKQVTGFLTISFRSGRNQVASPPGRQPVTHLQRLRSRRPSTMLQEGSSEKDLSRSGVIRGGSNKHIHLQRPGSGLSGTGFRLQATIGINTMACRLDELVADKWLSIRQARFLAVQEAFHGDEFLQDVIVDFVVAAYPRIVDVYDYLTLVGCLEDRSQAFVVKRVGWLAAWNPCRPEGYIELALDTTEDRQVAKMLIHLAFEHHVEHWTSSSFRWSMYDTPIPGWMLPVVWNTEAGLPHKGVMALTFASRPSNLRVNWTLRMALAQVVSLGGAPPVSALVDKCIPTTREGEIKDDDRNATGTSSGVEQSAGHNKLDNIGTPPSLRDLNGDYDRDFVDAICRQAGSEFFLYGADPKNY
ncbi:unnamed protein product [Pylaiella littoralis]